MRKNGPRRPDTRKQRLAAPSFHLSSTLLNNQTCKKREFGGGREHARFAQIYTAEQVEPAVRTLQRRRSVGYVLCVSLLFVFEPGTVVSALLFVLFF